MRRRAINAGPAGGRPVGETTKYKAPSDPLQVETTLKDMEPTQSQEHGAMMEVVDLLIKDPNITGEEKKTLRVWKANLLASTIGSHVKKAFVRDFWAWLVGQGSEADVKRTFWGRRPLTDDPEVEKYIALFPTKMQEFRVKLYLLGNRRPIGINECFLFYKYIVRGDTDLVNLNPEFLKDWETFGRAHDDGRKVGNLMKRPEGGPHEMAPYDKPAKDAADSRKKQNEKPSLTGFTDHGGVAPDEDSSEDEAIPSADSSDAEDALTPGKSKPRKRAQRAVAGTQHEQIGAGLSALASAVERVLGKQTEVSARAEAAQTKTAQMEREIAQLRQQALAREQAERAAQAAQPSPELEATRAELRRQEAALGAEREKSAQENRVLLARVQILEQQLASQGEFVLKGLAQERAKDWEAKLIAQQETIAQLQRQATAQEELLKKEKEKARVEQKPEPAASTELKEARAALERQQTVLLESEKRHAAETKQMATIITKAAEADAARVEQQRIALEQVTRALAGAREENAAMMANALKSVDAAIQASSKRADDLLTYFTQGFGQASNVGQQLQGQQQYLAESLRVLMEQQLKLANEAKIREVEREGSLEEMIRSSNAIHQEELRLREIHALLAGPIEESDLLRYLEIGEEEADAQNQTRMRQIIDAMLLETKHWSEQGIREFRQGWVRMRQSMGQMLQGLPFDDAYSYARALRNGWNQAIGIHLSTTEEGEREKGKEESEKPEGEMEEDLTEEQDKLLNAKMDALAANTEMLKNALEQEKFQRQVDRAAAKEEALRLTLEHEKAQQRLQQEAKTIGSHVEAKYRQQQDTIDRLTRAADDAEKNRVMLESHLKQQASTAHAAETKAQQATEMLRQQKVAYDARIAEMSRQLAAIMAQAQTAQSEAAIARTEREAAVRELTTESQRIQREATRLVQPEELTQAREKAAELEQKLLRVLQRRQLHYEQWARGLREVIDVPIYDPQWSEEQMEDVIISTMIRLGDRSKAFAKKARGKQKKRSAKTATTEISPKSAVSAETKEVSPELRKKKKETPGSETEED